MRRTSAPSWASVRPAVGPATKLAISTTETPVSTRSPGLFAARRSLVAVEEPLDHGDGLGMAGRRAERAFEHDHPRQRGHEDEQPEGRILEVDAAAAQHVAQRFGLQPPEPLAVARDLGADGGPVV